MAKQKKLIPCRVCGKMFEPCSYCQQHQDVFRWRNFACSIECAKKYIAETEAYRAGQKESSEKAKTVQTKKGSKKTKTEIRVDETVEVADVAEEVVEDTASVVDDAKDTDSEVETAFATDMEIGNI